MTASYRFLMNWSWQFQIFIKWTIDVHRPFSYIHTNNHFLHQLLRLYLGTFAVIVVHIIIIRFLPSFLALIDTASCHHECRRTHNGNFSSIGLLRLLYPFNWPAIVALRLILVVVLNLNQILRRFNLICIHVNGDSCCTCGLFLLGLLCFL